MLWFPQIYTAGDWGKNIEKRGRDFLLRKFGKYIPLKGSEKIHCGRKVYILIIYLLLADGFKAHYPTANKIVYIWVLHLLLADGF